MKLLAMPLLLAASALVFPTHAADEYPARPIRLIVPQGAGGSTDIVLRILGLKMSANLGQSVVIDNRTGAGGTIGVELGARADPDGYTLVLAATGTHATNPALRKLPYDPIKDFEPISMVVATPYVLVVHPAMPVNSVMDLVKLARAKPGQIHYASSGNGTMPQLSAELLKYMARIDMLHVPYRASPPALADVLGGRVSVFFAGIPTTLPHIKAGRLRSVAVTSLKRTTALPELPTVSESGVAGYEATPWMGLLAPARTPRNITQRLNREVVTALAHDEVRTQLLLQGAEPNAGTREAMQNFLLNELVKWRKLIVEIGIRLD